MATNLNVVYSDTFKGAGMVSGGPYMAEKYYPFAGLDTRYLSGYTRDASYLATHVTEDAKQNAAAGLIDPVTNLKNMPIYILSNTQDTQVDPALHDAQKLFYDTFESNVQFV